MTLIVASVSAVVSLATVFVLIKSAASIGMVQRANERSSHVAPTPTGGGAGIVLGTIAGLVVGGVVGNLDILGILIPAVIVAAIGFVDDRWPLPSTIRLVLQVFLVSTTVIWQYYQLPELDFAVLAISIALAIFLGVWWVNLFNFMDGIDGFAAAQAIFMLSAALIFSICSGVEPWVEPLGLLMISALAATTAFLAFNWPPARVFMGDIGSTFLGFTLFALALASSGAGWLTVWQWSILGALFTVDASVTLVRRFVDGHNIFEAHRSHAYQRASRRRGGHRPVTLGLIAANCGLIFPAAWLAGHLAAQAWIISVAVHMLLIGVAIVLGSGRGEDTGANEVRE